MTAKRDDALDRGFKSPPHTACRAVVAPQPDGRIQARWLLAGLVIAVAFLLGSVSANADRLLFVGNSYLQDGGGVHVHTAALAKSVEPERRIEVAASTIRGSRLDEQDISAQLAQAPYDRVVLQGHSTAALTDATQTRFRTAVRRMHDEVARQGGQTVLYMTPAYSPAHPRHAPEMFARVAREYIALGREIGAAVIPVGLAFEIAYARRPDIVLHKADGSHHTAQGTYLSAATAAVELFGIDPMQATYAMDGAIAPQDAAFLRAVAADAVGQTRAALGAPDNCDGPQSGDMRTAQQSLPPGPLATYPSATC